MTAVAWFFDDLFTSKGWYLPLVAVMLSGLCAPSATRAQYNSYSYELLYAGPRGTTVVAPPAGPGPLDPFAVWARFGFWPNPYIARQPIGHQTIATGPNGYVYRPVYADDETAASIALPERDEQRVAPGFAATRRSNQATPESLMQAALVLFRAADYDGALDRLDHVLQVAPDDGHARLLAVQAYFALGRYRAAADALTSATEAASQLDWDLYVRDYRKHFGTSLKFLVPLRTLEQFVEARPDRTDARLLLAYEYGCLGFGNRALDLLARLRGELADRLRDYLTDEPPAPAPEDDDAPAQEHRREF